MQDLFDHDGFNLWCAPSALSSPQFIHIMIGFFDVDCSYHYHVESTIFVRPFRTSEPYSSHMTWSDKLTTLFGISMSIIVGGEQPLSGSKIFHPIATSAVGLSTSLRAYFTPYYWHDAAIDCTSYRRSLW